MGVKTAKQATNKNLEILFDLDADALSFATVHGHHLKKSAINLENEEDDDSEGTSSAAIPSPAILPCMNPNKEAMRKTIPLPSAKASAPSEEKEGDTRAADGG